MQNETLLVMMSYITKRYLLWCHTERDNFCYLPQRGSRFVRTSQTDLQFHGLRWRHETEAVDQWLGMELFPPRGDWHWCETTKQARNWMDARWGM